MLVLVGINFKVVSPSDSEESGSLYASGGFLSGDLEPSGPWGLKKSSDGSLDPLPVGVPCPPAEDGDEGGVTKSLP